MKREGAVQNFVFYFLITIGLVMFGYRYWKTSENLKMEKFYQSILTEDRGDIKFDAKTFLDMVVRKHPRIAMTPVHLVVFLNPDSDCPACLFELEEWSRPLKSSEVYGLTLFMPNGVSAQVIQGIINEHAIDPESIIYYNKTDGIAGFHNLGVFKVVLTQDKGIVWYEKGSVNDKEYKHFYEKLCAEIELYESHPN